MDFDALREFCLSLPLTEETTPFDETTLVYKVCGKMFALTDMVESGSVSVKCDPALAEELRDRHPEDITPAYHFNKKHWNSVRTDGDLPANLVREQIMNSYWLVVNGLPKAKRVEVYRLHAEQG